MASFNNRHWPSMFRSKHAAQPWQTQPDVSGSPPSLVSGGSTTTTTTGSSIKHSFPGGEDRTPEVKARWNPRPEQIRILEAIFNAGMVNPPRDEIPRIRMRLQEYGPVGDANVFYWFQNRKARSKNKLRAGSGGGSTGRVAPARAPPPARLQPVAHALYTPPPQIHAQHVQLFASPVQAPTSSSSSSSDRSSGSSRPASKPPQAATMSATEAMDLLGPLAAACPQVYSYQTPPSAAPSPKVQLDHAAAAADETIFVPWPQGYCLSAAELAAILGAQYMHVPAHQQQPQHTQALPAVSFLGLCNDVPAPTINGHRSWGSGPGQYWPSATVADHHQLCKNNAVTKEVAAHEDAAKPGLLQYDFGVGTTTAMDAAASAATTLPLSASPEGAVTVASVAAAAGLTTTTANGVVTDFDQLQGLADHGVTGGAPPAPAADSATALVVAAAPADHDEGVAVLCVGDSATGRSVVREVAARHLDVRAQFGDAAVLFRYVGDGERPAVHVPVDAATGCTVEPLQHGVVYWVLV
ncbi:hypothetical protein EJB05_17509, partial [Eragrostis curvula]